MQSIVGVLGLWRKHTCLCVHHLSTFVVMETLSINSVLLSSFSCADSSWSKRSPCSVSGKPCNPCLDAVKACNLNETCKRLRSAYTSICSKATPPQPSLANPEPCSRKRCQKVRVRVILIIYFLFVFLLRVIMFLPKTAF